MTAPVTSITIVGGGTAGWMTALLLYTNLNRYRKPSDRIKVTLIESPNIPTVGVGEATVPNMPRTLVECGISESQFFRTCNSSFKLGVLFDHWNVDEDGKPIQFVNPFMEPPLVDGVEMAAYYLKFGAGDLDFVRLFAPSLDLFDEQCGPRGFRTAEFSRDTSYAYHLDAGKFAGLLREVCVKRGVTHIYDNLQEVEQDERGYVSALQLEKTGKVPVELVIDCTGFRGLVINQVLGGEFINYSKYLANDKAMAVQIPHSNDKIEPMTRATALGAGWSWRVPLYNRIGTGYVYSSAHRTDEEARDEFMAFLGPAAEGLEPRVIPMRIGRNRETWIKNCVAIGLSGGFIEPLESTAIHMIDMAVRQLITHFPDQSYAAPLRKSYNRQTQALFDEVLDFICLHYRLGNRTDSLYWIDAREELQIPDRLAENLELWKHALPMIFHLDTASFFGVGTYHSVLIGKRVYEMGYGAPGFAAGLPLNEDRWWEVVAKQRARFADMVEKAPDHRHLLRDIRGELSSRERRALERGEMLETARAAPELAESSLL